MTKSTKNERRDKICRPFPSQSKRNKLDNWTYSENARQNENSGRFCKNRANKEGNRKSSTREPKQEKKFERICQSRRRRGEKKVTGAFYIIKDLM